MESYCDFCDPSVAWPLPLSHKALLPVCDNQTNPAYQCFCVHTYLLLCFACFYVFLTLLYENKSSKCIMVRNPQISGRL